MNDEYDSYENKLSLCVLATQMGKTFSAIKKIKNELDDDNQFGRSVHMIFTMNTLLSNSQFAMRLDSIEKNYGTGSVVVFASKYKGKFKHVKNKDECLGACVDTCRKIIVMCSNKARFDDGNHIIKGMNNIMKRVFIYYDELHAYINDNLRKQIEELNDMPIVKHILALTATPENIFKDCGIWKSCHMIKLNDFQSDDYVGVSDIIFNQIEDYDYENVNNHQHQQQQEHVLNFITHVLDKFPEILNNNTRTFIPAFNTQESHIKVRDIIFEKNTNAVVIVLNGTQKTLQYYNNGNIKTICLNNNDEEVCLTIAKKIEFHNLQHFPIVITGLICVGMGQTLMHPKLGSFTSAIFSHLYLSNDNTYQLFGRILGRMKKWEKYCQTEVYCPRDFMNRCNAMHECALNMIHNYSDKNATLEDYKEHINHMDEEIQNSINKNKNKKINKEKKKDEKKNTDPRMTVPIMIHMNEDDAKMIIECGKGKKELEKRKELIQHIIYSNLSSAFLKENNYKMVQTTMPNSEVSYKKHIIDVEHAINNNKSFWIDFTPSNKNTNCYNCYIDNKNNRLFIIVCNGCVL